jgi:hypothetical protein
MLMHSPSVEEKDLQRQLKLTSDQSLISNRVGEVVSEWGWAVVRKKMVDVVLARREER